MRLKKVHAGEAMMTADSFNSLIDAINELYDQRDSNAQFIPKSKFVGERNGKDIGLCVRSLTNIGGGSSEGGGGKTGYELILTPAYVIYQSPGINAGGSEGVKVPIKFGDSDMFEVPYPKIKVEAGDKLYVVCEFSKEQGHIVNASIQVGAPSGNSPWKHRDPRESEREDSWFESGMPKTDESGSLGFLIGEVVAHSLGAVYRHFNVGNLFIYYPDFRIQNSQAGKPCVSSTDELGDGVYYPYLLRANYTEILQPLYSDKGLEIKDEKLISTKGYTGSFIVKKENTMCDFLNLIFRKGLLEDAIPCTLNGTPVDDSNSANVSVNSYSSYL